MIDKLGMVALLLAVALSGCTSSGDDPLTAEDCEAQGLVLFDPSEGTMEHEHDDEASEDHHAEPSCVEPETGPRGSVALGGVPATTSRFSTLPLTWTLGTTLDGEDHAMLSEIRFSTEPLTDTSAKSTDWGEQVAVKEHQNFFDGKTFQTNHTFETEGTFYFRAFALIGGVNLWSGEAMVTVGPVAETGVVHVVTVSGSGPQAELDKSSLTINVGDKVQFVNDDLLERTFTGNGFEETVAANGGTSAELLFLEPGSVSYDSATMLSPLGDLSGTINISS